MPEIVLENVTKKFGNFVAVDNLSLVIDDRSFVTLLGPSGCGKTTTLRMIAGLETPTTGTITIDGKTVFSAEENIDISPDKRDIGFLFQNYALWPHMTVYKNIAFGLENMKWGKSEIDKRVNDLCEMLKIEEFQHRYPSELSGGQQQRVAIARTLATGPKILFMDEPLSNLDAKLRMEMRTELKRLHIETDSTFVYVTHDQLEAMTLSTKICLMEEGVLQQYAPPLTVYHEPENLFVADFVGNPTMNFLSVKGLPQADGNILLSAEGFDFSFKPNDDYTLAGEAELMLGIRPEHVSINEWGDLEGEIYSSLPSGMETIVRLKLDQLMLTSVVFGGIDFAVGQKVKVGLPSAKNILFDKSSTNILTLGEIELVRY